MGLAARNGIPRFQSVSHESRPILRQHSLSLVNAYPTVGVLVRL